MRKIRVAINGYGRIGRSILRALYEKAPNYPIEIVAINDVAPTHMMAHLTRYDTTHGKFPGTIEIINDALIINHQDEIKLLSEKDTTELPWKALDIDIVYECTGRLTQRQDAAKHLLAGAKKVLISAPGNAVDATLVYGINHELLKNPTYQIISNSSCTTNCLAMLVKPLHEHLEIQQGLMTTVHSYTNDQALLDSYHIDPYRARAAAQSMIPTKTGAAAMIGTIFPELEGKLDGLSIRVPTANVSLLDLTIKTKQSTNLEEVNQILKFASTKELCGLLEYNDEPLVSSDFNHHTASAIFSASETRVIDNLVKVFAWYDNEWGFSNRMLDITIMWFNLS
jgi:glyceraldehyde 3-phosphate dehydrogenase